MSKSAKISLYSLIMLLYGVIMVAFLMNYFIILIIVPFLALGWAVSVLVSFIKDLNKFREDIKEDSLKNWGEVTSVVVEWEEEPRDIEWKFETAAMILFPLFILAYWVIGIAF